MWEVETIDDFDKWWKTLTEQEQDDVTTLVELLEEMDRIFLTLILQV